MDVVEHDDQRASRASASNSRADRPGVSSVSARGRPRRPSGRDRSRDARQRSRRRTSGRRVCGDLLALSSAPIPRRLATISAIGQNVMPSP